MDEILRNGAWEQRFRMLDFELERTLLGHAPPPKYVEDGEGRWIVAFCLRENTLSRLREQ